MKILKILKIIPSCKQIYGPWIVSSGKKVKYHDDRLGQTKNLVWSHFSSFRDVRKFNLLNYCISYVTLAFRNQFKIFVISNYCYYCIIVRIIKVKHKVVAMLKYIWIIKSTLLKMKNYLWFLTFLYYVLIPSTESFPKPV